jgi:K+/H+ antiporter YhaU regulatory subunit KhtT
MSYATMGATAIINHLGQDSILMVSEGLELFEVAVPVALAGRTIAETDIRAETGVTIVAVRTNGETTVLPSPETILPEGGRMVLIGQAESEQYFLEKYDD